MAYDLALTPEQKAKKALVKKAEADAALLLAKENDKKLKKAMEQRIRKQMAKQKAEDELNLNLGKGAADDCEDARETREKNKERLQLGTKAFGEKADIKQFEKRTEQKKTPNKRFTMTMNEMESDYFRPRPHMASRYHRHLEEQFPVWLEQSGNTEYDAFVKEKLKMKAEAKAKEAEEAEKELNAKKAKEMEDGMKAYDEEYSARAEAARKYQCSEEEEAALMKLDLLVDRLPACEWSEWDWLSPDSFKNRVWFFNGSPGYDLEELRMVLEEMEERLKEVESQSGESMMDEEVSELGSVGGSSVGENSLNSFGENVSVSGLSAGPSTTPPLPKPRGRAPKGKVWDEVVGWVDDPAAAEEAEAEESGDAKRAKLAEPLTES